MIVVRQLWAIDGCGSTIVGYRWLWFGDYGPSWVMVRWSWIVGPMTVVLILGCGSPFDGLTVVGGGSGDGPMVGDCGPMGMGRWSQCSVFNGTVDFGPGLHRSTG